MIVKIFNQGTGNGKAHIDYLFDYEKHKGFNPQLLKGNAFLTEQITGSITNKNKYISGVIAFRDNEILDKNQLLDIIDSFEATVAPFADKSRVNFLWVLHKDKNNTELHFISPRIELDSRKALDIHPNTKTNLLLYEHFTRATNFKYGFQQTDKKPYFKSNFDFSKKLVRDLVEKRAVFFQSKYCEKKLNVYNKNKNKNKKVKNGMQKNTNGSDGSSRKSNNAMLNSRRDTKDTATTPPNFTGPIKPKSRESNSAERERRQRVISFNENDFKSEGITQSKSDNKESGAESKILKSSSLAIQLNELMSLYSSETNALKRMTLYQRMIDVRFQLEMQENAKRLEEDKTKKLKI